MVFKNVVEIMFFFKKLKIIFYIVFWYTNVKNNF
jgi:hypothetical protein